MFNLKEIIRHLGKRAYLLNCQELDEKNDITLMSVL